MKSIAPYIEETLIFLGAIFFDRKQDTWELTKMSNGLEGIPERWIQVFELDGSGSGCDVSGTSTSAIFRPAVTILTHLRDLEPVQSNVFKNLQFIVKVQQEFQALLFERDERALWLFGYWLGILCRFKGV
jgi:hypothetical protein